jgi:hypothetical protein
VTRGRQRNRGFFSGLFRGVSDARESSKILTFLFPPRLLCSVLLHLRSSLMVNSPEFARKVSKTTNPGNRTWESPCLRRTR